MGRNGGSRHNSSDAAEKTKKKLALVEMQAPVSDDDGCPEDEVEEDASESCSPSPKLRGDSVEADFGTSRKCKKSYAAADYLIDEPSCSEMVKKVHRRKSKQMGGGGQDLDESSVQEETRAPGVCENDAEGFHLSSAQQSKAAKVSSPGYVDSFMSALTGKASSPPEKLFVPSSMPVKVNVKPAAQTSAPNRQRNEWVRDAPPIEKQWSNIPSAFPKDLARPESYKENGVVTIDEEEAAEIIAAYEENALVGRVVGINFQFEWLASQLQNIWGTKEGFYVNDLGQGCFIMFFDKREDRDAALCGGPWFITGFILALDIWSAKFIPSMNPEMLVPTWVKIPELPLHLWGDRNLGRIAMEIGEPMVIDAYTKTRARTSYARICVRRNLAAPMLGGVWLKGKATGKFFQKVIYEGVASLCTTCGFSGHAAEECKQLAPVDMNEQPCGENPRAGLDGWTIVETKRPPPRNKQPQAPKGNPKQPEIQRKVDDKQKKDLPAPKQMLAFVNKDSQLEDSLDSDQLVSENNVNKTNDGYGKAFEPVTVNLIDDAMAIQQENKDKRGRSRSRKHRSDGNEPGTSKKKNHSKPPSWGDKLSENEQAGETPKRS